MSHWAKRELLFHPLLKDEWGLWVHLPKTQHDFGFFVFCLYHLELRGHSGHARENKDSPAAQRYNPKRKKERKHFLNKASSHLDLSAWGASQENPQASLRSFTHSHTVHESGKSHQSKQGLKTESHKGSKVNCGFTKHTEDQPVKCLLRLSLRSLC